MELWKYGRKLDVAASEAAKLDHSVIQSHSYKDLFMRAN